jgi:hypothetical protein
MDKSILPLAVIQATKQDQKLIAALKDINMPIKPTPLLFAKKVSGAGTSFNLVAVAENPKISI